MTVLFEAMLNEVEEAKLLMDFFPHKCSAVILLMLMEVIPPYYILKTFYQSFKILNYVTWQCDVPADGDRK